MSDLKESNIKALEEIIGVRCSRDEVTGAVAFYLAQGIVFDKETHQRRGYAAHRPIYPTNGSVQ